MLKNLFRRKGDDKNDSEDKLIEEILENEGDAGPGQLISDTQKQTASSKRIAEIDVLINGMKEQTVPLYPGRLLVGRDPSQVELVISELIVSKSHCTFLVSASEVLLRDNDSTNGTYLHGEAVEECRISEDVLISLGRKGVVQLHVRFLGENSGESSVGDTIYG